VEVGGDPEEWADWKDSGWESNEGVEVDDQGAHADWVQHWYKGGAGEEDEKGAAVAEAVAGDQPVYMRPRRRTVVSDDHLQGIRDHCYPIQWELLVKVLMFLMPDYVTIKVRAGVTYPSQSMLEQTLTADAKENRTKRVVCVMNSTILPLPN
jgi:hypothetical protein